jgi:hypothetical protein
MVYTLLEVYIAMGIWQAFAEIPCGFQASNVKASSFLQDHLSTFMSILRTCTLCTTTVCSFRRRTHVSLLSILQRW